jgi:hypothetical protein
MKLSKLGMIAVLAITPVSAFIFARTLRRFLGVDRLTGLVEALVVVIALGLALGIVALVERCLKAQQEKVDPRGPLDNSQ